jgi:hypothetical protein
MQDRLNCNEEENPDENDTVGNLINKLSISTIKMWDNQDILYKIRFMNTKDFENEYKNNMPELHQILKRCCDLNVQRSKLIDEIDRKIFDKINGG